MKNASYSLELANYKPYKPRSKWGWGDANIDNVTHLDASTMKSTSRRFLKCLSSTRSIYWEVYIVEFDNDLSRPNHKITSIIILIN